MQINTTKQRILIVNKGSALSHFNLDKLTIKLDEETKIITLQDDYHHENLTFNTQVEASEAFLHLKRKMQRSRGWINVLFYSRGIIKWIVWPLIAIGFMLSFNGAMMNLTLSHAVSQNNQNQPPIEYQQPITQQPTTTIPTTTTLKEPASKIAFKLHNADKLGSTIMLNSGHPHSLYVFADPLCPHCRELEPYLMNALGKQYNIHIVPVSTLGGNDTAKLVTPLLCESQSDVKVKAWNAIMDDSAGLMDEIPTKSCEKGEQTLNINNHEFLTMGLIGTPTLISDTGKMIPLHSLSDGSYVKYF